MHMHPLHACMAGRCQHLVVSCISAIAAMDEPHHRVPCCACRDKMPDTYAKALRLMDKMSGISVYEYDVCSGAKCGVVYRAEWKDAKHCPSCNTPRYITGKTSPRKKMHYLSIRDYVRYMFSKVCTHTCLQPPCVSAWPGQLKPPAGQPNPCACCMHATY